MRNHADQDAPLQGKRTEATQLDVYKLLKPMFQGINDDMGSCHATVHSKVCLLGSTILLRGAEFVSVLSRGAAALHQCRGRDVW